ncbi:ribonuclease H-like domain-containing protein [Tanacetum coccineum]|uniref:Ribonuclease H-like domain-containing protein n=1 Tax=Tanacetum coccineum TaxID=301880 RepID=A0ABQ5II09_9ASTR
MYMHQPPSFVDPRYPHHVCLLKRSLYGLKQTPRAWFHRFAAYATRVGFSPSRCDSSLFIYRCSVDTTYLLIYVDDIVLTDSSIALLQKIIFSLHKEFDMTDLGALNYFLGISVTRDSTSMFLSPNKYAMELLKRAHMLNCNPTRTPVDTESELGLKGTPISDPTLYRSLADGLQYLTFSRPDLCYVVQQICLYMHDPWEPHLAALKRIFRYVQGNLEFGLQLYASSGSSLMAYSDTDWAGCPATRRSTSGYCVFIGENLLSWSAKRQHTLLCSSAEAEYQGVANVVVETAWLCNLLQELYTPLLIATLVYCDTVSDVYLFANPVQHQQTKHIDIDIHFVCDMVAMGHVRLLHASSRYEYADIFTKGLPSALFEEIRTSLSVRSPPAQTARESLLKQQLVGGPKGKEKNVPVAEVWSIDGGAKTAVASEDVRKFYSGDCYIVLYSYHSREKKDDFYLCYWIGKDSTEEDQNTAAKLTTSMFNSQGETCLGILLLGVASCIADKGIDDETYNPDSNSAIRILRTAVHNNKGYQVDPVATSLNSNECFVIYAGSHLYIWQGTQSTYEQQQWADKIAELVKPGVTAKYQKEGTKSATFWLGLGGKESYTSNKVSLETRGGNFKPNTKPDLKPTRKLTAATQSVNALAFVFEGVNFGASDIAYAADSMKRLTSEENHAVSESLKKEAEAVNARGYKQ